MDVRVNTLSEVAREIEITAPAAEIQPQFEKKYAEYRGKLDIKGFRKGKAPLDMVKKLYGEMIEQDSLQEVASELYRQAVRERELKPIGEPTLVDMGYKRGEEFRCKIQYDIRPQITLSPYAGIKVQRPVHTITEAEIESEVLRLRRMNAALEPAAKVTDIEHVVTATLQDVDDQGMPIVGKRTEGARFYLADDQLETPFKDAFREAEAGSEHRITFEHDHGDHKHTVKTRATVSKVERVVLPPFDDAFVSTVTKGKATTTADFLANLRNDLEEYWASKAERAVLNGLTAELLRRHTFAVPESLVRAVLEGLAKDLAQQYPKKQLPENFDYDRFWEENRAYAEAQAKWALLREELIAAEKITVEDADLDALAQAEAAKINIDKERLIQYYRSSDQVRERLTGDKLMQRLLAAAVVEDVDDTKLSTATKG